MKKEIKALLIALNSTGPCIFKYPIGNKELTVKVKDFESKGLIKFNPDFSRWEAL